MTQTRNKEKKRAQREAARKLAEERATVPGVDDSDFQPGVSDLEPELTGNPNDGADYDSGSPQAPKPKKPTRKAKMPAKTRLPKKRNLSLVAERKRSEPCGC